MNKNSIAVTVFTFLWAIQTAGAASQPATSQDAGVNPRGLAAGDLMGNGSEQLAVANFGSPTFIGLMPPASASQTSNVQVFNYGAAGLALAATIPTASSPRGISIFDLTGKGQGDLLVTAYGAGLLQVFGRDHGHFVKLDEALTGTMPVGVAAGTTRGGSSVFAVVADYGSNQVSIYPIVNGKLGKRMDLSVDAGPVQLAVGNLGGNFNSIVVACMGAGKIDILTPKTADPSSYSVTSTLALPTGSSPSDLCLTDLNGDGKTDMVVADFANNDIQIFLQGASGTLSAQPSLATSGQHPNGLTVGDLDGDGKPEIIVANRDSDTLDVFAATGTEFKLTQTLSLVDGTKPDLGPVEVALLGGKGTGPRLLATTHMRSNSVKTLTILVPTPTPDPAGTTAREIRPFGADTTYCYPNPAHGVPVRIHFNLLSPAQVDIQVFDVEGILVFSESLSPSQTVAGENNIDWNLRNQLGSSLASGTYLCRVTTGGQSAVRKISIFH